MTSFFTRAFTLCIVLLFSFTMAQAASTGDPIEINLVSITNVTCHGGNDGSITITVEGGIEPTVINWSTGDMDVLTVSGLSAGMVSVTVTDNIGESETETFTIGEPDPIVVSFTNVGVINCNNPQANITASATGGNGGFTYNWSNGATGSSINVSSPEVYTVTVTDSQGCTGSNSTTVDGDLTPPDASAGPDQELLCFGDDIMLSGSGSTGGNFSIQWSTSDGNIVSGGFTYTPTVNASGTYTLTVTNQNNGCATTDQVQVTGPPDELQITLTPTDVSCFGENDGSISASVTGGVAEYTFSWSNDDSGSMITGLDQGSYTVTVTDNNGCTTSATASIEEPEEIIVDVTTTDQTMVNTNDGTATASVSGGTSGYEYLWSNGSTSESIDNLSPGTYTVTVTDANGCTSTGVGVVLEVICDLEALVDVVSEISCFGANDGSLTAIFGGGNGGVTYAWSNGGSTQTISNLGPGTYEVTVTDAAGCEVITSGLLFEPLELTLDLFVSPISGVGANDGEIFTNVSGGTPGYEYLWSNGSTSASLENLGPGTYSVTVTDSNGCTISSSTTINEIECDLAVSIEQTGNILCFGDETGALSASVTGQDGNVTFSWSNGAGTSDIAGLPAGTYSVTVMDELNCIASADFIITEPTALSVDLTITEMSGPDADDGAINSSVSGGNPPYSYAWSNGANTPNISNLPPEVYTVTVTDDNGCTSTQTAVIPNVECDLEVSIVLESDIDCFGNTTGSLSANITGGEGDIVIEWSNGSSETTLVNLGAGNYGLTVTDDLGCTAEASFNLGQPAVLNVNLSVTGLSGDGSNDGSIAANVTGGTEPYSFEWSNGSTDNEIEGLSPGNYSVTVTDANGCTSTASATINAFDCQLDVDIDITQAILCFGDSTANLETIVTNGDEPFTYQWSNGETSANLEGLPIGTYTVTVTDDNECVATSSIVVTQPDELEYDVIVDPLSGPNANDGAISIITTDPSLELDINWSTGENGPMLVSLSDGTYCFTMTDINWCEISDCVTIDAYVCDLIVEVDELTDVNCFGGNDGTASFTTTGGTSPITFDIGEGIEADMLSFGEYVVTATDDVGCVSTDTFFIDQPEPLVISIIEFTPEINTEGTGLIEIGVSGGTGDYDIQWFLDGENNIFDGLLLENANSGEYTIIVTDENGCEVSIEIVINLGVSTLIIDHQQSISVFPNPASEFIQIEFDLSDMIKEGHYAIYGLDGKIYDSGIIDFNERSILEVNINRLAPGSYFVQLTINGTQNSLKFIKQ